ncbi:MAG: flippase-like domain-containing protein [Proteobacteria bacterium]|nr:flippase-like domain-containing protein [Pseudomonadota bacterium]
MALGRTALAAGIGLLVGAAFWALAFRGVSTGSVWALLEAGQWGLAGPLVLLATGLFVYAKAVRWRVLLGGWPAQRSGVLWRAVLAGLALNACLPHAGEFVRAFGLQRTAGRAAAGVLSSIVAERLFDLFAVLVLGAAALVYVEPSAALATAFRALGAVAAVLAVLVLAAVLRPDAVRRGVAAGVRPLPATAGRWVVSQVGHALEGLAPVRSVRAATIALAWSLGQWLAVAAAVAGCLAIVGLRPEPATAMLVVVGIVVAFLLPNAPGYAGSVQVAFLITLRPLGADPERALAASVAYQLLMVLPLVVGGFAVLRSTLAASPGQRDLNSSGES